MKKIFSVLLLLIAIALLLVSCEQAGGEVTNEVTTPAEATADALPETLAEITEEETAEAAEEVTIEAATASPAETTAAVTEPITEPITEPVTEPITEPVTELITEPVTEPITEPVTEPITEPVTEPITEPATEPVTEPPHEHIWSAWTTLSTPSCEKEGKEERICACGESESKVIAAVGHKEAVDAAKAATCTESGLSEGRHCSVCSTVTVAQNTLPALGHKEVIDEAKAATCTESGLSEGKHCSVCKTVLVAQKTVPALGHSEVTVKGTPATESEYGISDKIYCKVCSLVIKDHKKLYPLGFDIPSNYSNDYGYNYLGTLEKGEQLQSFYRMIDEKLSAFHKDVTTDVDSSRIAASVNYSNAGLTYNEAISVYNVYRNDHPLYYWVSSSWSYTPSEIMIQVDENYLKGADRARFNDIVYSSVAKYVSIIENETSAYHITLGLFDAVVNSAEYAYEADGVTPEHAEWAHSIIGILDHGLGVCESYSELFSLLLNYCDINNVIVQGIGNGGSHSWNMVELDNEKWYWCDPTWAEIDWLYGVTHTSFCVTDTQDPTENIGGWTISGYAFSSLHTPSSSAKFGKDYIYALPASADTVFSIDDTMLYDTFVQDGTKYMVIGYDTVYCGKYWGISGKEPETLTYNGRTYKVIVDK